MREGNGLCLAYFRNVGQVGTEQRNNNSYNKNVPDTDVSIGVTSVEGVSVGRPSEGEGLRGLAKSGVEVLDVLGELGNNALALQIPDLDGGVGGGAQPVSVGGEDEGVDGVSSIEGVQVLALIEIPKAGSSVSTTRSTERTVWADSASVQVTSVSDEVGL